MALPVPALVGITDTNALASRACNAARNSVAENLFTGLAVTGRSNTYISAHVPAELARHLADVAEGHPGLDLREAERVLWNDVMPLVPVVDLAVGDYLHPRIQAVRRADPALPVRLRGDVRGGAKSNGRRRTGGQYRSNNAGYACARRIGRHQSRTIPGRASSNPDCLMW